MRLSRRTQIAASVFGAAVVVAVGCSLNGQGELPGFSDEGDTQATADGTVANVDSPEVPTSDDSIVPAPGESVEVDPGAAPGSPVQTEPSGGMATNGANVDGGPPRDGGAAVVSSSSDAGAGGAGAVACDAGACDAGTP